MGEGEPIVVTDLWQPGRGRVERVARWRAKAMGARKGVREGAAVVVQLWKDIVTRTGMERVVAKECDLDGTGVDRIECAYAIVKRRADRACTQPRTDAKPSAACQSRQEVRRVRSTQHDDVDALQLRDCFQRFCQRTTHEGRVPHIRGDRDDDVVADPAATCEQSA